MEVETGDDVFRISAFYPGLSIMLNRPPPYFPQGQLSPPDEKRYRKFKLVAGVVILGGIVLLSAIGVGICYLISWAIG